MGGKLRQLGAVLLAAGVLAGCKSNHALQDQKYPDPLCKCHKPVEGKPRDADPEAEATARLDPPPPPVPAREGSALVRQRAVLVPPRPLQAGLDQPE